jgi:hypothetical protein
MKAAQIVQSSKDVALHTKTPAKYLIANFSNFYRPRPPYVQLKKKRIAIATAKPTLYRIPAQN